MSSQHLDRLVEGSSKGHPVRVSTLAVPVESAKDLERLRANQPLIHALYLDLLRDLSSHGYRRFGDAVSEVVWLTKQFDRIKHRVSDSLFDEDLLAEEV
jgi:hypothetical protein